MIFALLLALSSVQTAAPRDVSVLVLDPSGDVDEDQRVLLGGRLARALEDRRVKGVVTAAELRGMLRIEADRQELGCDDAGCAGEIADALGAAVVVVSQVTKEPGNATLSAQLIDVRTARVLARSDMSAHDMKELRARVDVVAAPIARELGATDPLQETAAIAWPVSFVAGAVVVASAGLAYDLLAPTSSNRRFDAVDLVGPAAYVSAAGLGAAALFNPFALGVEP